MKYTKTTCWIIGKFGKAVEYGITTKQLAEGYTAEGVEDIAIIKRGDCWNMTHIPSGLAVGGGYKTRDAAIEEYQTRYADTVAKLCSPEKLEALKQNLSNAVPVEVAESWSKSEWVTLYDHRLDKMMTAAKKAGLIVKRVTDEEYQHGGKLILIGNAEAIEAVKAAVPEAAPVVEPEAEKKVLNLADLTEENIKEYLPSLMLLLNHKTNAGIIVAAAIDAGVMTAAEIIEYFTKGRMPAVHTFNAWKDSGYIVKKGSKARFEAYIWKHTTKTVDPEEEGKEPIEPIETEDFYKVKSYFFSADQVERIDRVELETLPEDCKKIVVDGREIISGNTKPIKEQLKKAGYRWNKKDNNWSRRAAGILGREAIYHDEFI